MTVTKVRWPLDGAQLPASFWGVRSAREGYLRCYSRVSVSVFVCGGVEMSFSVVLELVRGYEDAAAAA